MNKFLISVGCALSLSVVMPMVSDLGTMTVYAAEGQSTRWTGSGDDWRVSDNKGGYLKNCWFQDDVTNHWYLLGTGDGSLMYAGLVTDNSTNKSYYLNVNHDGTYGRMVTLNGTYIVNGVNVYLEFNQNHDGSYGAITQGLSEIRNTGVTESKRESIPTDGNDTSVSPGNQSHNQERINDFPVESGDFQFDDTDPSHWDTEGGTGSSEADWNFLHNR